MLVVVKARLQAVKFDAIGAYDAFPVLFKRYCTVSLDWDNRWRTPARSRSSHDVPWVSQSLEDIIENSAWAWM